MIDNRPKIVKVGFGLGILGGILAIAASVFTYDGGNESVINVGLCFVLMVFFFALGGGFARNGSGTWGVLTGMSAITAGICIAMTLYGSINVWLGSVMTVIALLMIVVALNRDTARWIKTDRLLK